MAYKRYIVGSAVTVTGRFTDVNGALQDPSDAQCRVVDPTGESEVIAGTRVSTGVYTVVLDTTGKVGRWQYLWFSPGPIGQSAATNQFFVDPFPTPTP